MICSILLLLILTSCVSGTFVVNVTKTSYQAEENQDLTLEWTFSTNPHSSSTSLNVFCELLTVLKDPVLFRLHEGVEVPWSRDEHFAGRVHWDKDVLTEGRLRLNVSRLRTEDSGLYKCYVETSHGRSSGRCWLTVSALTTKTTPPHPKILEAPAPDDETGVKGVHFDLSVLICGLFAGFLFILCFGVIKAPSKSQNQPAAVKHLVV